MHGPVPLVDQPDHRDGRGSMISRRSCADRGRPATFPTHRRFVALVRDCPGPAMGHNRARLIPSTATGPQPHSEVEGSSKVQDQVSRRTLARISAGARRPGRRDALALGRGDRCVSTGAVGSTGWAEEVLGRVDRHRVDAAVGLQVSVAPDRGLSAVRASDDAGRSRCPGSHHSVAPRSAARSRARSDSGPGATSSRLR